MGLELRKIKDYRLKNNIRNAILQYVTIITERCSKNHLLISLKVGEQLFEFRGTPLLIGEDYTIDQIPSILPIHSRNLMNIFIKCKISLMRLANRKGLLQHNFPVKIEETNQFGRKFLIIYHPEQMYRMIILESLDSI